MEWSPRGPCNRLCNHVPGVSQLSILSGVDTDELDSNVDDWEEETIEFFVTEEVIPLGSQE